jgi:hypothetical protein
MPTSALHWWRFSRRSDCATHLLGESHADLGADVLKIEHAQMPCLPCMMRNRRNPLISPMVA